MELQHSIYEELMSFKDRFNSTISKIDLKLEEMIPEKKELLTMEQIMQLLSIKRSAIEQLMKDKIIVGYRLRRRIYFKRSQVMKRLEEGKISIESKEAA